MDTRKVSLKEALAEIPDFRQAQGRRYELLPILLLSCVAMLCGSCSESAIAEWGANYGAKWLRRLGIKRRSAPSQPTIHRIFKRLDVEAFERAISRWVAGVLGDPAPLEGVAIDGKALCGALKQGVANAHLLSAVSHRLGTVLAQVAVGRRTNEIGQMDDLLEELVLIGLVVTVDAMHTQVETAQTILEAGGDYLMVVKGNQPTLKQEIAMVFETTTLAETVRRASETTTHGSRIETRSIAVSDAMAGLSDWPGLQQVMKLERSVINKTTGEIHEEMVFGVTSLLPQEATPAQLNHLWRKHWTIENKVHWVRDVTFKEDLSQVRSGNAPQVMAALRNIAISALRLRGVTNIAAALRKYAAQPAPAFTAIGIEGRE
jgi:predicted transposase YbfD/YdcC